MYSQREARLSRKSMEIKDIRAVVGTASEEDQAAKHSLNGLTCVLPYGRRRTVQ